MQRKDVERLARLLDALSGDCAHTDGWADGGATCTEAAAALRALLAERDAAFAAGPQSAVAICKRVRSEEAENDDQAVGALECAIAIMDEVNALAAKPRP